MGCLHFLNHATIIALNNGSLTWFKDNAHLKCYSKADMALNICNSDQIDKDFEVLKF